MTSLNGNIKIRGSFQSFIIDQNATTGKFVAIGEVSKKKEFTS